MRKIEPIVFCIAAICSSVVLGQGEISSADPTLLTNKVTTIVNDLLKYNEMQSHLDSLSYSGVPLEADALLTEMAGVISTKFKSREAAVVALRDAAVAAHGATDTETSQCCQLLDSVLTNDTRFLQLVSTTQVCERRSESAWTNATHLAASFLNKCVSNLGTVPALKWQYYGSEQGMTTQFPANKVLGSCTSYDNRYRPWYIEANVPRPKQIAIVIDTSGSMSNTYNGVSYMTLAKEAAKTIIATLNPGDQFVVIGFSSDVEVFSTSAVPNSACYANTFATATPYNTKKFNSFVDTFSPGGSTNYGLALGKAFDFFDNLDTSSQFTSDRAILFMSDGEPTDGSSSILSTLTARNSAVNNSVIVMTYGMGNSLEFTVLQNMATATTVQVGPDRKPGIFTKVTTPSNLRNEMASYYNFFSIRGSVITSPIWTVPYLDAWGLGLMITAALPVYVSGSLAGVAAVDITIEELLAESSFFKPTELTYAFVINQAGLVINHPLFPTITDTDPLFVEATAFERDSEFLSVFNSMKSGGSGNKSFTATRILPQGDSKMYGVRQVSVASTYYWKQIPDTTFSLCLVLADSDTQAVLGSQGSLSNGQFLYHRLDLVPPPSPCNQAGNYADKDHSSVALAARSFKDPELYLSSTETSLSVQTIENYMEGSSTTSPNIKTSVKNMVVATYRADSLWLPSLTNDLNKHVFWRYVASSDGIFRNFPATQMPSNYDPVVRGWYQHAEANRGTYVITPPYSDAASGISIVTMAGALYEGKSTHDPATDKLVGAMGIDFVLSAFQEIVNELYPFCNSTENRYKCLMIDQSGFVIMAPQFATNAAEVFDKHIADLEPEVASVLIGSNILEAKYCSDIKTALVQKTYLFPTGLTRQIDRTAGSGSSCQHFQLIPVASTNAYLVMVDTSTTESCTTSTATCDCSTPSSSDTPSCSSSTSASCTCPCTSYNDAYFPCTNTYTFTSTSPYPCTPQIADLTKVGTPVVDLSSLAYCYNTSFYPIGGSSDDEDGLSTGAIVGICVGCAVGVAIVVFFLYNHYSKKGSGRTNSSNTNPPAPVGRTASPATVYQNTNTYNQASAPAAIYQNAHTYDQPPPANPQYYDSNVSPPPPPPYHLYAQ